MEGTDQLKRENANLFLHCYKGLQLSIAYNYSWKLYSHISQSKKEIKTLFKLVHWQRGFWLKKKKAAFLSGMQFCMKIIITATSSYYARILMA